MLVLVAAMAMQAQEPWKDFQPPAQERLGPGPHTLVISDGAAITRMEYRTGQSCLRARDEIRRQVAPPAYTGPPGVPHTIYGAPSTKAFCVPR